MANLANKELDDNDKQAGSNSGNVLVDKVAGVKLYVDEHNTRAQQAYKKMGMEQAHYLLYHLEFEHTKPSSGAQQ